MLEQHVRSVRVHRHPGAEGELLLELKLPVPVLAVGNGERQTSPRFDLWSATTDHRDAHSPAFCSASSARSSSGQGGITNASGTGGGDGSSR
jgi:hypothetical protein